jgi:hypothetical protein
MANTVIVLSEEFLKRVQVALGELPAKFAVPVIQEVEAWITLAEKQPHKVVELVDKHMAEIKDKIAQEGAKAALMEHAMKLVADKAAADAKAAEAAVVAPVEAAVADVEKVL